MSLQVKVFENTNVCPLILSFLSLRDNCKSAGINRAVQRAYTTSFPKLVEARGKRLLERIPAETREAFEEQFGKERLQRAPVHHYPAISGISQEPRSQKFLGNGLLQLEDEGRFATPIRTCKGDHFHIGICRNEQDSFLAVRVNYTAKGKLCGSLVVHSEILYHSLNPFMPFKMSLETMEEFLQGCSLPSILQECEEEPGRCCLSRRLYALFRRCLFETVRVQKQLA